MQPPPAGFAAREKAAFTTFDGKLFVFGGLDASGKSLGDGAIYDPAQDSWTLLPTDTNTPSARQLATAIGTGLRLFVVGGTDASSSIAMKDGARFDPANLTWMWLPELPYGRVAPLLVNAKDAGYVMTWGGTNENSEPLTGGERYVYSGSSWLTLALGPGSPAALTDATWATADSSVYLFGGRLSGDKKSAASYLFDEVGATWSLLSPAPLSARWGAFGVFDGTSFYVWGGRDETGILRDGARYNARAWSKLVVPVTVAGRVSSSRRSGYALALGAGDIAFLGGMDNSQQPMMDGARYQHATGTWSNIAQWPSREWHEYGVFVASAGELFVWGGRNGSTVTATGERYLP
jgi:N-acetylneuraminic acid mutarotase